jgi:uncharacterized protein YhdP
VNRRTFQTERVTKAAKVTSRWLVLFTAVCIILFAILLIVARIGLPLMAGYKGDIEKRLSARLGNPVTIESLSVQWQGFGPKLHALGVSVSETQSRKVVLDEMVLDLALGRSFVRGSPSINNLTLVGAELALEASKDGQFTLHGMANSGTPTKESTARLDILSWLMSTDQASLLDARITFINADTQQQMRFQNVNVVAVNDGDLHKLRVDMQLPDALGEKIELGIDLTGSRETIASAESKIHIKASNLKPNGWRDLHASQLGGVRLYTTGIAPLDANVNFELWGYVAEGQLKSARGQLTVADAVNVETGQQILDRIATDVVFDNTANGWQLAADSVDIENDGEITTVKDVLYQYKPSDTTAWTLNAKGKTLSIDLATTLTLSLFSRDADLPRTRWLANAQPSGTLYDWQAALALKNGKPDLSIYSLFNQVQLNTAGGVPGVKNLGGVIDMKNNLGIVTMQGKSMRLDIPTAFSEPLQLEQLTGEMELDLQDPLRTFIKGNVVIDDKGLESATRLEVKLSPEATPHVFVQSQFTLADIAKAKAYIPTKAIRPATTRWLKNALVSGEARNGELIMFGHVGDFPYANNEGVFKFGFDLKDASLSFLPTWPNAEKLQGRFEMNGTSMAGQASDGYIDALRLSKLDVQIDDFRNPYLSVKSTGASNLAELVNFANTGPLKRVLRPALQDVKATGRSQMDLSVEMPLRRKTSVNSVAAANSNTTQTASKPITSKPRRIPGLKVNGSIFLNNNTIKLGRAKLDLNEVNGAYGFTHNSLRVNNLQAKLFGRPIRIDGKTTGTGANRVAELTLAGAIRAKDMLDNYGIPLTGFVDGESQWTVNTRIPMNASRMSRDGLNIAASSSLVGTHLDLPKPLNKPRAFARSMELSATLKPTQTERLWSVKYDKKLHSLIRVNNGRMKSLAANFGQAAANSDLKDGIQIDGVVAELQLDEWVKAINQLIKDLEPAETQRPVMPISAELNVASFIGGVQSIGSGQLRANTDNDFINLLIQNELVNGTLRYPRKHWISETAVQVRLKHIDKKLVDALNSGPRSDQQKLLDPRTLPPITARIDKVRWNLLSLSDLTLRTSPSVSGLNIDTIGFAYPNAQLIGTGYWRMRDPQQVNAELSGLHTTKLDLTLQSNNFGRTLDQVGYGGTLSEGEGVLAGSLVWPGPAYKPSVDTLVGELEIDLQKGRILKVDPGAAKLAGLFALHTIPRRLSLDFKDLVLDGLDYETVKGKVQLANGVAHTTLVQLNGSVGVVDIAGESNLVSQTYNQRITVLPRVSSALPIIGVISGGATAGLGALFAGGLLKAIGLDFDRIGLREYTLTGSWENPDLTVVPFEASENAGQ